MSALRSFAFGVLMSASAAAFSGAIETHEFASLKQESLYNELVEELRCLVCQNNNLADSNAELAQDMRRKVAELITKKNASKADVVDYMVQRYGDFVLYNPPVKPNTLLLWAGPGVLLLVGLLVAFRILRKSGVQPAVQLTEHDRGDVKKLLDSGKETK